MEAVDQVLYNSYVKNFEKYPYPICLLDLDKIIYLNQECKSLLDLNTSDINLSIVNFIHDDYKVLIQNRLKNRKLGLSVPAQLEIKLHTPKKSVFVSVFTLDFPIGIHKYTHVVFGKLNDVQAQKIMHIPDENTNIISNLNFLNTLIDTIPNPIYYKNLEGIYIGCNQAFVDFMGVGKEKLLGKLPSEVPPVILANIYHDGDMSLIKKNDSETYEGKSRDISGEIKDIIYHKTVFFDSKNVVGGMVCTLVDITKHKQAKKALKESEVRVKLALEASMLGLWDFNLSKHEIYLSPEYYIILGYAPNDFFFKIEEWLTSFYDSNNNPIELLNGPFNTIRDKIDGKEYKVKTKEGGFKWVLLKGKIVEHRYAKYDYRITGTIRDISAQKEAELAVQESEMRFRSVLEASNDAIVVLLNNNDLVYWNKKAAILFATNQEELSNSGGFKQLFEKSEWLKLQKLLDEIVSTSTELSFESTMFSLNGLQVPVLITITPIEIKRKLNLVLTIKDLTAKIKAIEEKKKLEEQLRHAQKMETIGTLAGGIAHDFNNILTPILGYTQMAMSDLDEESPIFEDLGHVYKAATRARDLVKQILTFSRRIETEKVNVYVHLIINEVLGLILATLPANIKIEKNIHSKMAIVNIAPTQLHQVIMNMCTNAYQSMKENGGVLTIDLEVVDNLGDLEKGESTLTDDTYIKLKIVDTGKGIEKKLLSRIFEPFFTTKEVGQGTGLGLSVAHGIIKDSKGEIFVNSKIDVGTEFTIYLPHVNEIPKPVSILEPNIVNTNLSALVVDDDIDVLGLITKALVAMGFAVESCNSSTKACEIINKRAEEFNLLVTDQVMPDKQGVELVQILKRKNPLVKSILITGFSSSLTDETAKEFGVDKFLMKPIIIDKLAEAIFQVLA